ncbi:GntR family transcriptional regulator [Streptosporangium saharense]|uniref:DNA-binding transcriptional regulator YhcF (GntR family) n=1 Tax=Streptosporangium saharense TaxID=1706840 RepID=A0A7W7QPY5_9ACTN|nr:GntR family transcriptional regulator [Streptosporangium saharense]MBB4916961.1 DNA-binding transcriptional regulator YhcF (GntR family) [Streptosporangium saharense]
MELDPDDPRPPYLQVAHQLRAAILTRKFTPGEKLPSGPELAKNFGVARMTVQQAIRQLRDEGLVVSRQGSGVFVRERTARPVGLRPHIEQAFKKPDVTIEFAGFSGETLHGAIQEPLDGIRAGKLIPDSITIRMLVPDTERPWSLPCRVDSLEDEPLIRKRMDRISSRHAQAIVESVQELRDLGLVKAASAEIRVHGEPPRFKLYVLNAEEAFFGFYPISEHTVALGGAPIPIFDLGGKDAELFHFAVSDGEDSTSGQFVRQSRAWFDNVWNTVGREVS